jgi:hypothetical protein
LAVAFFQNSAGYMDADYYYAGGIRLTQGHGFSELALWNYLDDPGALPHPSHAYWYPLASVIAAAGMKLTGSSSYGAARLGFILVGAMVAPLTAALAFRLTRRADLAVAAGALGLFPTFLTAFLPVTDNYGLYMTLGAAFFLLLDRRRLPSILFAGLCAGLMNLSRSDGLLWAGAGLAFILLSGPADNSAAMGAEGARKGGAARVLIAMGLFLAGYALIMGPWFARNYSVWGTLLAPGGNRALMLHDYADTFAYPASRLTPEYLLASGADAIASARWGALLANLNTTFTVQISIFLLPFALTGLWTLRHETIVQVSFLIWLGLLVSMSLLFPFAGPRGSFSHAGAALYSVWWSAAVAGVGATLAWAEARGWNGLAARKNLLLFGLVTLNALISGVLVYTRISSLDWNRFDRVYRAIEAQILRDGASPGTAVMAINPPAYFTTNRRAAIMIPDEDVPALRALADRYDAGYLILERGHLGDDGLARLYDSPESDPSFHYIGQIEDARIYRILP